MNVEQRQAAVDPQMRGNNFWHPIPPIPMILFPFPFVRTYETSISFPFIPEKQFQFPPITIPI